MTQQAVHTDSMPYVCMDILKLYLDPTEDHQLLQVVGEIAADAFAAEAIVLAAADRIQVAVAPWWVDCLMRT